MNIKQAKQEIKRSIQAYLAKDELGNYRIPSIRQRPVLVMGPPGIGKTQIMEQVARECGVALVAYTITHHTRQSAVGLPFIQHKNYGGTEYAVTEYTMSEIIASIYEKMEQTGLKEGILFIDEINCVSETLAPTMLQFLQQKTFGSHRIPEGWIIAAAGNPPEYNKSVKEFDIVTLDRVKKIDVQENFSVWKEYAYQNNLHGAIISYLEIKKENFYRIQTTVDGKLFATARGWEDLSQIIQTYEILGLPVDQDLIIQYIQFPAIAKDFANYLELYYKYQTDYQIEAILSGMISERAISKLKSSQFDEHLSVIGLLLSKLSQQFQQVELQDLLTTQLFEQLKSWKTKLQTYPAIQSLVELVQGYRDTLEQKKQAGQLDQLQLQTGQKVLQILEKYVLQLKQESLEGQDAFELVKNQFQQQPEKRKQLIQTAAMMLDYAFDFMEASFGNSQEMVIFITELTANYFSMKFINEHGCDRYYMYNKGLLFQDRQKEVLEEIQELTQLTRKDID